MKKFKQTQSTQVPLTDREMHNLKMHRYGRIFTTIALAAILLVPVVYCIEAKVLPDGAALAKCIPFLLGYVAIGLIEAFSYAPLLGTGGQYISFITGNVSNLKLPCAINAQSITGVKEGSEEQEIVTTISIAVSSIVTTVIVAICLIPIILLQDKIVAILSPLSPYVIPAIFGGISIVLLARYLKIAIIPFIGCLIICVVWSVIHKYVPKIGAPSQSVMVIVGMVVSGISTIILYKKGKI